MNTRLILEGRPVSETNRVPVELSDESLTILTGGGVEPVRVKSVEPKVILAKYEDIMLQNNYAIGSTYGFQTSVEPLDISGVVDFGVVIVNTGDVAQTLYRFELYMDHLIAHRHETAIPIPAGSTLALTSDDYPIFCGPYTGIKLHFWTSGSPQALADVAIVGVRP